jgi:putative sterol carrier protein
VALEAFSQWWAEAWAGELNASPAYRSAAEHWEGAVALVLEAPDPPASRAVLLDLWHGECRSARTASPQDAREAAAFVFQGGPAAWRQVLCDGGSPILALMSGRIRLAKGSLAALIPYAAAAKELLDLAARVPTTFPEMSEG